jgi:uncharacterized low-complexity protein
MIQAPSLQKVRMPLLGFTALVVAALLLIFAAQTPFALTSSDVATSVQPASVTAQVAPARPAESGRCGDGAYVTGDLAGDASPAAVYKAMCADGR